LLSVGNMKGLYASATFRPGRGEQISEQHYEEEVTTALKCSRAGRKVVGIRRKRGFFAIYRPGVCKGRTDCRIEPNPEACGYLTAKHFTERDSRKRIRAVNVCIGEMRRMSRLPYQFRSQNTRQ